MLGFFSNLFLAETISSLLNKTKIIRFGGKKLFSFFFMFSTSQHVNDGAALKSHEAERTLTNLSIVTNQLNLHGVVLRIFSCVLV